MLRESRRGCWVSDPWLDFQLAVSYPLWVLETEHRSSAKAVFILMAESYLWSTYFFKIRIFTKIFFLKKMMLEYQACILLLL